MRSLWGTAIARYAEVSFSGELRTTEEAKGQSPVWTGSQAIRFDPRHPDEIDAEKIIVKVIESKKKMVQATIEFDAKEIPKEGKMVSILKREFDSEEGGVVKIEAWCEKA